MVFLCWCSCIPARARARKRALSRSQNESTPIACSPARVLSPPKPVASLPPKKKKIRAGLDGGAECVGGRIVCLKGGVGGGWQVRESGAEPREGNSLARVALSSRPSCVFLGFGYFSEQSTRTLAACVGGNWSSVGYSSAEGEFCGGGEREEEGFLSGQERTKTGLGGFERNKKKTVGAAEGRGTRGAAAWVGCCWAVTPLAAACSRAQDQREEAGRAGERGARGGGGER